MTRLRIKLLAASVAALAAADSGSAQVFRSGTARGVAAGISAVTGIGSQGGYNAGFGSPYGYNAGYGSQYGQNAGYGYGSPQYGHNAGYGSPVQQYGMHSTSPQFGGWNTQSGGVFGQQTMSAAPGTQHFPSANQTYSSPGTTYFTSPTTGMVQSGYTTPMTGMVQPGMVQSGGFVTSGMVQPMPFQGTTFGTGVSTATQFGIPQQAQMGGNVVQTGASMPQTMSSGQIVTTQVLAPDGATVTLSGTQADRTQGPRPFVSPPLDPNTTYTYRAKATWTDRDGKPMTREKSVDVRAGQQVTIDLTNADASDRQNDENRGRNDDQNKSDQNKSEQKPD